MTNYASMTVVQLKALLQERGLHKAGRKEELVARLKDADVAPIYSKMTVVQLKKLLRQRGKIATGRKEELIERLKRGDEHVERVPKVVPTKTWTTTNYRFEVLPITIDELREMSEQARRELFNSLDK